MNKSLDQIHQYCKEIANIINSVSKHECIAYLYVDVCKRFITNMCMHRIIRLQKINNSVVCNIKFNYTYKMMITFDSLQLYVPLNIFVALVGVVVWTEQNEIELSNDGDKTLKNFLNYRRKTLIKDHPNDNAQLLTKVQFEGGVVGKTFANIYNFTHL